MKKKKVLVAMSGGVDSSVAAALLSQQGFSCVGVFMHFWSEPYNLSLVTTSRLAAGLPSRRRKMRGEPLPHTRGITRSFSQINKYCSIEAQEQARRVAQKIGFPLYTLNYQKPFREIIVDNYIAEYQAGRTPNPCVLCNQFIKFDLLLREAERQGCDYLATGHYAQIKKLKNGQLGLFTSPDIEKDQTYFIHRLSQNKLEKILFPVGKYKKPKVRQLAKEFDLPTAMRRDSQGICFVATTNEKFLKKYLKVKPGSIVDVDGVKIGEHQGLLYYTVGQRHGYGSINLKRSKLGRNKSLVPPLYVINIDIKNNTLVVGREEDLYQKELIAENVEWISGKEPSKNIVGARIRYRHPINKCRIKKLAASKYQITFTKSQRAITPGQSVVFYNSCRGLVNNNQVLGGGIIAK